MIQTILVLFIFIVGILFKSSFFLGKIGEAKVSVLLSFLPKEYTVFNNVLLYIDGKSSQIDHIVVSAYGIFVIETKNYKGWIFGSDTSRQWTQNIYGEKHSFYNPVLQNQGHIFALKKLLNLPADFFISVIAFSSKATLKGYFGENVMYISEVNGFIKSYTDKILTNADVLCVIEQISENNLSSSENQTQHIQEIEQNREYRTHRIECGICPRCGAKLVVRNGRYGQFMGCSNYPKCRFTQKIDTFL